MSQRKNHINSPVKNLFLRWQNSPRLTRPFHESVLFRPRPLWVPAGLWGLCRDPEAYTTWDSRMFFVAQRVPITQWAWRLQSLENGGLAGLFLRCICESEGAYLSCTWAQWLAASLLPCPSWPAQTAHPGRVSWVSCEIHCDYEDAEIRWIADDCPVLMGPSLAYWWWVIQCHGYLGCLQPLTRREDTEWGMCLGCPKPHLPGTKVGCWCFPLLRAPDRSCLPTMWWEGDTDAPVSCCFKLPILWLWPQSLKGPSHILKFTFSSMEGQSRRHV